MKKYQRLFLALLALVMQVSIASAKDYTDQLTVNMGGNPLGTQTATVSLNKEADETYTFLLKNFVLGSGEGAMPVGTIEIKKVKAFEKDDVTTLIADANVQLQNGDDPQYNGAWMGASMPPVPIRLLAEQRGKQLYAIINIPMGEGMNIDVTFGNGGYQIPNSDFEQFSIMKYTNGKNDSKDFDHWHSFSTADNQLGWIGKNFVMSTPHTFASTDVRPGSTGKYSLRLTSDYVWGNLANGTVTTGRLTLGSKTPTDPANHASMDINSKETDDQKHPFYVLLNGRPQSLKVWVKFKQGTPQQDFKYASVSAAITDGTYYQEPSNDTYNNVMAKAQNKNIESKNFTWQELTIPFNYTNNQVKGKAIMVTISTNAAPGKGSKDELYVDDLSLVYNQDINVNSISINGKPLTVADNMEYRFEGKDRLTAEQITVDTQAPKVFKTLDVTDTGSTATIIVASEDLKTSHTYKINIPNLTTGISGLHSAQHGEKAVYNLQGQRVEQMIPGNVYIIKQNGKTTKVYKK